MAYIISIIIYEIFTMGITNRKNLKRYNSFNLNSISEYFFSFNTIDELRDFCIQNIKPETKFFFLGGGSNILLSNFIDGYIIHASSKKIIKVLEKNENIILKVGAGLSWSELIHFCNENRYVGLENLTLIPGSVGAAPVQNIGAYGVEVSSCINRVEAFNAHTKETKIFSNKECLFSYRDSVFKHNDYKSYIVTNVWFELRKDKKYSINIIIREHLLLVYYSLLSLKFNKNKRYFFQISFNYLRKILLLESLSSIFKSKIVRLIRESVMPDFQSNGNVGSFFKSPIISKDKLSKLVKEFPNIEYYNNDDNSVKVSAAWLIKEGTDASDRLSPNVMLHHKRLGIVLNIKNRALSGEIVTFADKIISLVKNKFDIDLDKEVVIL